MKRLLTFLILSAACVWGQPHAELSQIQTVYLLKMRGGFDQHLANHLSRSAYFRVVTDPQKADAIFTDRVGQSFEQQLEILYPPPPPPEPPPSEEEETSQGSGLMDLKNTARPVGRSASGSSSTVFLVDRRSRHLVWSTFAKPKSYTGQDLDSTAKEVVSRLQATIEGKKK